MRFKVGDKVRVKDYLEVDEMYGDLYFGDYMEHFRGQIVTISEVYDYYYCIEEDNCEMGWNDEMLEPINKIESKKTESEEIKMEQNNNKLEQLKAEFEGLVKQYKIEMETFQTNFNTKLEELKKEIENEKNKKKPFIEEEQKYCFINRTGDVYFSDWTNHPIDQQRLDFGNYFPYTEENKEQVEKEVKLIAERRKLQNQMEMFARLNDKGEIDWDNIDQQKWYLYIRHHNNKITLEYTYDCRELNTTYFTSKEVAQKALEKFKDEIKRLYLN